jgi:putative drug exporter of the RND superfamily
MTRQIELTKRMYALQQQLTAITHDSINKTREMTVVLDELRDRIAVFNDFFRPIRNYFYWEPHCYDIPICSSTRSIFDLMDDVDVLSDKTHALLSDLDRLDELMPELLRQLPPMIATMETMRTMMLTMYSTMSGTFSVMDDANENATAMGQAFDAAKNDDSFYLPPEVFQNPDFQRAMSSFLSPDGKVARFIISIRATPRQLRA